MELDLVWFLRGWKEDTLISGGRSFVENWPVPIFPSANESTCPICLRDPMIRPVQIQCGHVICNPCIGSIMASDRATSKCPCCRSTIYEYRPLGSGRVRRPRDKEASEPLPEESDSDDPDYVPESARGRPNRVQDDELSTEDSLESYSQHAARAVDQSVNVEEPRSNEIDEPTINTQTITQSQASSGSSVIYLGEFRPSTDDSIAPRELHHCSQEPGPSTDDQQSALIVQVASITDEQARAQGFDDQPPIPIEHRQQATEELQCVLVDVEKIIAVRGRGKSTRYLVVYIDGEEVWTPKRQLKYAQYALGKFLRAKHVLNQTNYRKRLRLRREAIAKQAKGA